jgi:hypothetical protein
LVVVVPLFIAIISLKVELLDRTLTVISICLGFYRGFRAIKPSKAELEKKEIERKKDHYFYHCERNPLAFIQLRNENFEQETIEKNRAKGE